MAVDEALGDREAEADAAAGVAQPLERLEDPLAVGHGDARARSTMRRSTRPATAPASMRTGRPGPDAAMALAARLATDPLEQGGIGLHPRQRLVEGDVDRVGRAR